MFFFYNNRKPRKFQHRTILFDSDEEARKERMEKRIRRIQEEVAKEERKQTEMDNNLVEKTDFGKEFVSQTKFLKRRKEREEGGDTPFFTNNITIVLILAVLIVLFYLLFLR